VSKWETRLIRMGLVYLLLTGLLGLFFFIFPQHAWAFRTTHVHLGVLGFFFSLVMGVAFWMMPRPGGLRQEHQEAAAFVLLNAGLILRSFTEPWLNLGGPPGLRYGLIASGALLVATFALFAIAMNARVKTAEEIQRLRTAARRTNE